MVGAKSFPDMKSAIFFVRVALFWPVIQSAFPHGVVVFSDLFFLAEGPNLQATKLQTVKIWATPLKSLGNQLVIGTG